MLSSEDDFWLRQRRLTQPAFHRKRLESLAHSMTQAAQDMGDRWHEEVKHGGSFDVSEQMNHLTLQIVGNALLSVDLSRESYEMHRDFLIALEHIDYRTNHPFSMPEVIPTKRNRRFKRSVRELDSIVYRLITHRRQTGSDAGDLLSMLLLARDEETGEGMNDKEPSS